MSNFQQYHHKMVEYQLRILHGLDDDLLLQKLSELATEHGPVQSVKKIGEDSSQRKIYLICFDDTEAAMRAAYALEGKIFSKTSIVLMLH